MTDKAPKANHYVDNVKLTAVMIEWHHKIKAAKEAGQDRPPMPKFVVECVIKMAHGLAKKNGYRDYSWLDEMIQDGIEVCVMYLHNFDPYAPTRDDKGPNAYGYINKALERAFNTRIATEKLEEYLKCKSVAVLNQSGELERDLADANGDDSGAGIIADFVDRAYEYEKKEAERQAKSLARKAKKQSKKPQRPNLGRFFV